MNFRRDVGDDKMKSSIADFSAMLSSSMAFRKRNINDGREGGREGGR